MNVLQTVLERGKVKYYLHASLSLSLTVYLVTSCVLCMVLLQAQFEQAFVGILFGVSVKRYYIICNKT